MRRSMPRVERMTCSQEHAAFLYAYGQDQLIINRSEFRNNRVTTSDPGLGGAIRIDAVAFVYNTLFAQNDCAGQGGALWMGRGPALFENVTFFANHAAKWGRSSCLDDHQSSTSFGALPQDPTPKDYMADGPPR